MIDGLHLAVLQECFLELIHLQTYPNPLHKRAIADNPRIYKVAKHGDFNVAT